MDRDSMLGYLNDRPGAVEDYPFGDDVAVFKVGGRVFALCSLGDQPGSVSLKCDPTLAEALRDRYRSVTPGYHLNKRHWNTIELDGSVPDDELAECRPLMGAGGGQAPPPRPATPLRAG